MALGLTQPLTEMSKGKDKAIPLQVLTGPEGSRRLRLPDFKTIGTWRWQGCQPYAPAAFTPGYITGKYIILCKATCFDFRKLSSGLS
jgi:hypothetical protein